MNLAQDIISTPRRPIQVSIALRDSTVGGNGLLDLNDRFVSLQIKESDKKTDTCTLVLKNDDLTLFDDPRFCAGQILEITWGAGGRFGPTRRMTIAKPKGWRVVTLEGKATVASDLDRFPQLRKWEGLTYSDVAVQVARDSQIDSALIIVDPSAATWRGAFATNPHDNLLTSTINQAGNESVARMLARMAAEIGFVFYIDATGVFHFHRRRLDGPPVRNYSYGFEVQGSRVGEILGEPQYELNESRQTPGAIKVVGYDPIRNKRFEIKASNAETPRASLGARVEVEDPNVAPSSGPYARRARAEMVPSTASSAEEAKARVNGQWFHRSTERQRLTFNADGDPDVTKGQVVGFYCRSKVISGLWYVSEITTTIADGTAVQNFVLVRDGSKKVPLEFQIPGVEVHGEWVPLDYGMGENVPTSGGTAGGRTFGQTAMSDEQAMHNALMADINDQTCSDDYTHVVSVEGEGPDGNPLLYREYHRVSSDSRPFVDPEQSIRAEDL